MGNSYVALENTFKMSAPLRIWVNGNSPLIPVTTALTVNELVVQVTAMFDTSAVPTAPAAFETTHSCVSAEGCVNTETL